MAELLFRVVDMFKVPRRGLVLLPDTAWPEDPPFDQGDQVEVRSREGISSIERILYIGLMHADPPNPKNPFPIGIMIREDAKVSPGSEIWSTDKEKSHV